MWFSGPGGGAGGRARLGRGNFGEGGGGGGRRGGTRARTKFCDNGVLAKP